MIAYVQRFALSVACAFLLSAAARPGPDDRFSKFKTADIAAEQGRYLEAIDTLCPLAFDEHSAVKDELAYQLWNQSQVAITGRSYARRRSDTSESSSISDPPPGLTASDVLLEIKRRAAGTRIVILNEDHVTPDQRAFALKVARALRPLGYDALALEALNNTGDATSRMKALRARGHVVRGDGAYLREPVFAEFLRRALALGYEPFSYDQVGRFSGATGMSQTDLREDMQARALAAILRKYPARRVFAYVGASHLAEALLPEDGGTVRMAARLKAMTGIDPLTVDQITLKKDCVWCRRLAGPLREQATFMFRGRPFVQGHLAGAVDMQVFRPLGAGRPDGSELAIDEGWAPARIPPDLASGAGTRLIQAFDAQDGPGAIPVAQTIVTKGDAARTMLLPRRRMRWAIVQDARGGGFPPCSPSRPPVLRD